MEALEKLFYLTGIGREYYDFSGHSREISLRSRIACARAMDIAVDNPARVDAAIFDLDAKPWTQFLQPLQIAAAGDNVHFEVRLPDTLRERAVRWILTSEQGDLQSGTAAISELNEIGEYRIEDTRYAAYAVPVGVVSAGYYILSVAVDDATAESTLAVCPAACYKPCALEAEPAAKRSWGISCHLYTLRSETNWGIGDFADLKALTRYSADAGIDFLLLNPLHAPNFSAADFASPYSASDRRFLNPLYISLPDAAAALGANELAQHFDDVAKQEQLELLRIAPHVAYKDVAKLKLAELHDLFIWFVSHTDQVQSKIAIQYEGFVQGQSQALQDFARHAAAHPLPELEFSPSENFEIFLQWLARMQLQACQHFALECGMSIGLVGDLAVGAAVGGAETHCNEHLYCKTASIGAPPDAFNELGQNWALPAPRPTAMRDTGYAHFIDLLRANMQSTGGLRIDHVMGLMRLWWCLAGEPEGAYVYYPFEHMFALLRLESHRQQCCVIGEDMGVVEDAFRDAMHSSALFNNRLFYFERARDGSFLDPAMHSVDTLFMTSNHDVPTLAAWWSGEDLRLKASLGLLEQTEQDALSCALQVRADDRVKVLEWLASNDLLPAGWRGDYLQIQEKPYDFSLCAALHQACARSSSRLLSLQLEDAQLMTEPLNIPGTYREYPNWRRKQANNIDAIFADSHIRQMFAAINEERIQ
ncbi:MAG: 4-alpha-glucanotransferase [Gammaproteobacteria bacterium]|nr:4-alpha-glucanotransferase [Gammaproteobacteria bacterium]